MNVLAYIARGDAIPLPQLSLPSPLPRVSPEAWSRFVRVLCVQDLAEDTPRGLGAFAVRPRRLGDLGLVRQTRPTIVSPTRPNSRSTFTGDFVPPLTREIFLSSPLAQYNALVQSIVRYTENLPELPKDFTQSGALGILHSAGPGALRCWDRGPREGLRGDRPADEVERIFHRANGIF